MRLRVQKANIPDNLRRSFEEYGEAVVAQFMGHRLEAEPSQSTGLPYWVKDYRPEALAWLREQHHIEDRRRTVTELMEAAILVLVGVEATDTLKRWIWG